MQVIPENSKKLYASMAAHPPPASEVPLQPRRTNKYVSKGKSVVALVRSNDRSTALQEVLNLLGGLDCILDDCDGTILLKPNCNTDDPFPASTHRDMVQLVAEALINQGVSPNNIVVGDLSGKDRGLPTKWTMENIGLKTVADDLGLRLTCFEDEEWVTVVHPKMDHWPQGVRIPRCLYEAERVISLPAMKTHLSATFTLSLKNAVGVTDPFARDWLHNGEALNEKVAELNLAYSADLAVLDGLQCFTTRGPSEGDLAEPGVVIAGGDKVAVDTVGVAVLKQLAAENIADLPISDHVQLRWAEEIGLGTRDAGKIEIRASNPARDPAFPNLLKTLHQDLPL